MKTKLIKKLQGQIPSINFPKPDSTFCLFEYELREVVADAVGIDRLDATRNQWHFNEDEQEFVFLLHDVAKIGDFKGLFEVTMTLDPKKPLVDELERIQREAKDFRRVCEASLRE